MQSLTSIFAVGLLAVASCSCGGPSAAPQTEATARPARPPALEAEKVVHAAPQSSTPAVRPPSEGARTEDERNTISVFDAASPATVFVTQSQLVRDPYSMRATEATTGSGSGFIWDDQGHLVTNYHVIRGARRISVTLVDQKSYPAEVVGIDATKDIAVLKINAPKDALVPVLRPSASYELAVGQKTVAIGNPFGLDHTLTTGVVSALGREVVGIGNVTIRDMVQTDAAINPGNSGGPLLDSQGQLIGMNTIIFSKSGSSAGIGFAVPISHIQRVVPQIIKTGKPVRVGIGVSIISDHTARRAGIEGVIIDKIASGSPARKAGLRELSKSPDGRVSGDVIVGVAKYEVKSYDDLYNALDRFKPGDTVTLKVNRAGKIVEIPIALIDISQ